MPSRSRIARPVPDRGGDSGPVDSGPVDSGPVDSGPQLILVHSRTLAEDLAHHSIQCPHPVIHTGCRTAAAGVSRRSF